ncbi:MAG: hypothetical protein AB7V42_16240 [Thermoleophilia bacterium]
MADRDRPPPNLAQPRDLGAIMGDALRLGRAHPGVFVLSAFIVVAVVDLLVLGVGQGQLTSYDDSRPWGWQAAVTIAYILVVTPLVTAVHVTAVRDAGGGRRPALGRSMSAAFEVFPLLLGVVVINLLGVVVGLALLIAPGIYLFVRWALACQVAVAEEVPRPADALRRSWELIEGSWWRVLGIILVTTILGNLVGVIIALPFEVAASEAESGPLSLIGGIVGSTIGLSFAALTSTLLYFDLAARRRRPLTPPPPL